MGKEFEKKIEEPSINLELLKTETGLSIPQIAAVAGLKESKTIYKWAYPKHKGGARPTYETIAALLRAGASCKSLFGPELANNMKPKEPLATNEEFKAGIQEVLAEMLNLKRGPVQ